ncbi:MAG: gliding motility lipoprotein GldH [Bacteroidetes bacterium]|nr:gliding motility lipoprotein GldH [Bacteroidota bacterium]
MALNSCLPSAHYQKEYSMPGNEWQYNNKLSFKFDVTDTTSFYRLFFILRHTEAYPHSNIWVVIYTKKPGANTFDKMRCEIPLAEPSGKWMGRGMGSIWEHRYNFSGNLKFLQKGTWEIQFEQNTRINPLPEVLQVGLLVEQHPMRDMNRQP